MTSRYKHNSDKKIVDAPCSMIIGVGVDDIRKAKMRNSEHCAFARAALREPGVLAAKFLRTTAFLEYSDKIIKFALPASVQKEIVSFDRSGIVAPGTYQLSTIPPSKNPAKRAVMSSKMAAQAIVARLPTSTGSEVTALKFFKNTGSLPTEAPNQFESWYARNKPSKVERTKLYKEAKAKPDKAFEAKRKTAKPVLVKQEKQSLIRPTQYIR